MGGFFLEMMGRLMRGIGEGCKVWKYCGCRECGGKLWWYVSFISCLVSKYVDPAKRRREIERISEIIDDIGSRVLGTLLHHVFSRRSGRCEVGCCSAERLVLPFYFCLSFCPTRHFVPMRYLAPRMTLLRFQCSQAAVSASTASPRAKSTSASISTISICEV